MRDTFDTEGSVGEWDFIVGSTESFASVAHDGSQWTTDIRNCSVEMYVKGTIAWKTPILHQQGHKQSLLHGCQHLQILLNEL